MRRNGLLSGACYAVGDGKSINIWLDSWVPWIEGYKPKRKDDSVEPNPLVVDKLLNSSTREWRQDRLQQLFDQESIEGINKITITIRPIPDKLYGSKTPKGSSQSSQPIEQTWHLPQVPTVKYGRSFGS